MYLGEKIHSPEPYSSRPLRACGPQFQQDGPLDSRLKTQFSPS